ncbi:MAG: fibronectin type III domain-containing protein, partial [Planctomycetota bacterium]
MKTRCFQALVAVAVTGILLQAVAIAAEDRVEDVSKRDMYSRHYRLPNGDWQAVIHCGARHYMDDSGAWLPIDLRLRPAGNGEFVNETNPIKSRFSTGSFRVYTRANGGMECIPLGLFGVDGQGNLTRLAGSPSAPEAGNQMVAYSDLWGAGSRTLYEIREGEVKERIVLARAPVLEDGAAPRYFDFAMEVRNLGNLILHAGEAPVNGPVVHEGHLEARDSGGKCLYHMARPLAWEGSDENPNPSGEGLFLSYSVAPGSHGWTVSIRVPAQWLLDEERQYPVTIDPTFFAAGTNGGSPGYGWMYPTSSFVNGNGFTGTTGSQVYRSWYNWNIASIPDTSSISLVEHRCYPDYTNPTATVTISFFDYVGSSFGPYSGFNQAVYDDLGQGNVYGSAQISTINVYYPSSTTFYQLTAQAATDMMTRLAGDIFQIGYHETAGQAYKRFRGPNQAIQVTYATVPPAAPASITVPATSSTGIYTVSWAASTFATSYDLQEANNSSFTGATTVYSGANTSFQLTGKTNGTYYYRVRASNSAGNSAWTVGGNPCVVSLVVPSIPASITVPTSSVTGNYTVSWAATAGAWTYDLQEATNSSFTGATTVYTGANTSFNVTGKTTGTFWYRVRATNAAGSSGWRASTNGCQIVPPATPASITVPATSASGNYTVSWAASTGASGYTLQEATNSSFTGATTVYTGASTSYNVTGKTTGTFWYRVRATGPAGNSGWRNSTNGCQIVAPAAPTVITVPATSNTGNYTVSWNASVGATSYDLEEDTTAAFSSPTTVYTGANLSFGVTGKGNGNYYYRVRASNAVGNSAWRTGGNPCVVT